MGLERKGSTSSPRMHIRSYVAMLLAVTIAASLAGFLYAGSPVEAFAGGVGFGAGATGGGNSTVYTVTNLNDSGTGSFRDAVSQGNRVIDFSVSGYISLSSAVTVASNLTINGQTAPNPGIGIMGAQVSFAGESNDIVQNIRFRQGDLDPHKGESSLNLAKASDMIFDHVSVEFGQWDNIDSVGAKNITVQNSIIADPIGQQFNAHTETGPYTWYHDLFANSYDRSPLARANTQFINNVVYDYHAAYTAGHTSGHFLHDVVSNYFIAGPVTPPPTTQDAYFQMDNQSVYNSGNYLDNTPKDGTLDGQLLALGGGATALSAPWSSTTSSIPTSSAADAYKYVITDVTSLGSKGSLWTSQKATGLGNDGYGNA